MASTAQDRAAGGTLIIQPLPGIGDTIWHLPHFKAIARAAPDGKASLLTKPRSLADRLLAGEPSIERVLWLHRNRGEHDGLIGLARLVALLRRHRFETVWILHNSARYAQAAWLARIPARHGFGFGAQRHFLNRSGVLAKELAKAHPIDKATRFLEVKGLETKDSDRDLSVAPGAAEAVERRFGHLPQPWIAVGIGSSEPSKQWGQENFVALAVALSAPERRSLFLLGGPAQETMGHWITERVRNTGGVIENAIHLPIDEEAALLSKSSVCVGNDTGGMNLAAAVGAEALALFGGSPPLTYSPFIHCLLPADGMGMAGITPAQVLARLKRLGIE